MGHVFKQGKKQVKYIFNEKTISTYSAHFVKDEECLFLLCAHRTLTRNLP
jgi:hypothetical protein